MSSSLKALSIFAFAFILGGITSAEEDGERKYKANPGFFSVEVVSFDWIDEQDEEANVVESIKFVRQLEQDIVRAQQPSHHQPL